MSLRIEPLGAGDLDAAIGAHTGAWRRQRGATPVLPPWPRGGPAEHRAVVADCLPGPGVVAWRGSEPVGYLSECARFAWKGQTVALCREHAHAVEDTPTLGGPERSRIYQEMYAALAAGWVKDGVQLHVVCHFAGDHLLTDTLFRLGFGAILTEEIRDLAPVAASDPVGAGGSVCVVEDPEDLVPLTREHMGYYRGSPIFLPKEDGEESVRRALAESREAGDQWVALGVDGRIEGCFIVGACAGKGEGILLGGTRTAQLKSAYLRPAARGRGAGAALLDRCVSWARERGYERMLVEHETANIPGSAFWGRHFAPYLLVSMRYVDSCRPSG